MKTINEKPVLYKVNDLNTYEQWFSMMEGYGHIWFYIDGVYYFLFPEGAHKYGLCLGEDEANGNKPRWHFNSEDEFIKMPMFGEKTILERADDVMSWDPPFYAGDDEGVCYG